MTETTDYDFSDSGDYTVSDSDDIQVANNQSDLIDRRPTDATCHATYTSDINLNWGDGTLTGTATGGASVSGGKLALDQNDARYVDYDADANADSQQTGCIRLKITPKYSGSPASNRTFFSITKANGDSDNLVSVEHLTNGNIKIIIFDSTGSTIVSSQIGLWSPTADTEYEFELNFDITTGATRLFIGGTQLGSTLTGTGTRDASIALLRIGTNPGATNNSYFLIDELMIFSTVQHTANYTPASYALETIYATDNPTVIPKTGIIADSFDSFTVATGGENGDKVQYTIEVDGTDKYWTGSAWATADGTYSQSNTATEVNTNASTLLTSEATIKPKSFLHSEDGSTTPNLSQITIGFTHIDDYITNDIWAEYKGFDDFASYDGEYPTVKALNRMRRKAKGIINQEAQTPDSGKISGHEQYLEGLEYQMIELMIDKEQGRTTETGRQFIPSDFLYARDRQKLHGFGTTTFNRGTGN